MLFPRPLTNIAANGPQDAVLKEYQARLSVGNLLLKNLIGALKCASDASGPTAKKAKVATPVNGKGDIYKILDPSFSKQNNTVSESEGAILSRLTLGGMVNGLAGVEGAVVDTVTCVPLVDLQNDKKKGMEAVIESAGGLTLKELIRIGSGLHRSVSAR